MYVRLFVGVRPAPIEMGETCVREYCMRACAVGCPLNTVSMEVQCVLHGVLIGMLVVATAAAVMRQVLHPKL